MDLHEVESYWVYNMQEQPYKSLHTKRTVFWVYIQKERSFQGLYHHSIYLIFDNSTKKKTA